MTETDVGGMPPTRLALLLAGGLLGLVLLLSLLGPSELPVDAEQLQSLVDEGRVVSLEPTNAGLRAQLNGPVMLQIGGQGYRTETVRLDGPWNAEDSLRVESWRAEGVTVLDADRSDSSLRETAWLLAVTALLLFGVFHLVLQARLHRRDGSPRQRLDEARGDLDAGRISREEFERRAQTITLEL